jgi:hypothetical protein
MFFYLEFGDREISPGATSLACAWPNTMSYQPAISTNAYSPTRFSTERQDPHSNVVTSHCIPNNIMFSHEKGGSLGWSLACGHCRCIRWVLLFSIGLEKEASKKKKAICAHTCTNLTYCVSIVHKKDALTCCDVCQQLPCVRSCYTNLLKVTTTFNYS